MEKHAHPNVTARDHCCYYQCFLRAFCHAPRYLRTLINMYHGHEYMKQASRPRTVPSSELPYPWHRECRSSTASAPETELYWVQILLP